jgi:hypothetical protein
MSDRPAAGGAWFERTRPDHLTLGRPDQVAIVEGRRLAVFLTKTYTRIVNPSLAELDPTLPPDIADRAPLAKTWRTFEHALQDRINQAGIAA